MWRWLIWQAARLLVAGALLAVAFEGLYAYAGGGPMFPEPPARITCFGRAYSGPDPLPPDPFLGQHPVTCGHFFDAPILSLPRRPYVPASVVLLYFGQRLDYNLSGGG